MKAEAAVHKHESNMHKGKKPTKFSKGGGVTSLAMKKVGRNMARANYQRGK